MLRFLFRFLSTVSLAVAVVMAVLDATRSVASSALVTTPLGRSWQAVSPDTLAATQKFIETTLHPLLWDPVALAILQLPGFVAFGLLALILYAVGYRPERRDGFATGS